MRDGFIRKKVQKVVSKTGVQINIQIRICPKIAYEPKFKIWFYYQLFSSIRSN